MVTIADFKPENGLVAAHRKKDHGLRRAYVVSRCAGEGQGLINLIVVKYYWSKVSTVCYCTVDLPHQDAVGSGRGTEGKLDRFAAGLYEALTAAGFVTSDFSDGVEDSAEDALSAVAAYLGYEDPIILKIEP